MIYLLSSFLSLFMFANHAFAAQGRALNVYFENDSHNVGGPGSDNAYTNGFKISYVYTDSEVPKWARPLIRSSETLQDALKKDQSNFSFALGHQIYTPNNVGTEVPITNDRPYAAWLYWGLSANFKNEIRNHVVELDVGLIGPEAKGKEVQNGFHRLIGETESMGWKNQLGSEVAFQVAYQQRQRIWNLRNQANLNYFDVIPLFGGVIGTVATNLHVGGIVRFGHRLPDSFGPTRSSSPEGDTFIEPGKRSWKESTVYVFASARGTAVLRNLFLDGNTFKNNSPVNKKYFIGETELGFGGQLYSWTSTWSFVTRSPEIEEKRTFNSFAAVSISYSFE